MLKSEWGNDLGRPVAVLGIEPEEIARKRGIAFIEAHDDLDSVKVALFRAKSGLEYALVRHINAPKPGTEVLARAPGEQRRHFAGDLAEILRHLNLESAAVIWLAPGIRQRRRPQA